MGGGMADLGQVMARSEVQKMNRRKFFSGVKTAVIGSTVIAVGVVPKQAKAKKRRLVVWGRDSVKAITKLLTTPSDGN